MSSTDRPTNDPESITEALNRIYADGDAEPDPWILAAGIETFKRVEWDDPEQEPDPPSSKSSEPGK